MGKDLDSITPGSSTGTNAVHVPSHPALSLPATISDSYAFNRKQKYFNMA